MRWNGLSCCEYDRKSMETDGSRTNTGVRRKKEIQKSTVWNPSRKVNHLSKVIWNRKIITEFRSVSSSRIGKPVFMMEVKVSKDKHVCRYRSERNQKTKYEQSSVQDADIPVKILKEEAEYFSEWNWEWNSSEFNETICASKFPASLKFANVTPVFKQGSRNRKQNYRSVSIQPIISKIFQNHICRQLSNHFDNILSKFQSGFRKAYSPQYCPLLIIDKWKKAVDNSKVFGALLTDPSKAFGCTCHDLLVAYGLSLSSLKMIQDYLQNWKQRTKIGPLYST